VPSRFDDEIWSLVPEDAGEPPLELVRFVADLGHSDAALDLGCGDGRLTASLDARELTIADVSDVALERAAARLPDATVVRLLPDAALPLADNLFDLVLCADTAEHVRDLQGLLSEARRVLQPGGRLAIATPSHSRLTGAAILLRGFERSFPPLSPHLRFLTRRSLGDLLDAMGFEVESARRVRRTLLVVARR
jgi:ubiquinone/menaquinone biosynthesis C-methylase UbiE